MRLPDFLLVGAAKAGTSFVFRALLQHPQVFVPRVKEPMFFALEGGKAEFRGPGDEALNGWAVTSLPAYAALFAGAGEARAVGECSTWYLYSPLAARRIRARIPHARIVAILREPADRAHSAFLHLRRDGREPERDFARALAAEPDRIRANYGWLWHYRAMGCYAAQVERYLDAFPGDRLRFVLYDDLREDPAGTLRGIFEFLGVDPEATVPPARRENVSTVPRFEALAGWLDRPSPARRVLGRLLRPGTRRALLEWGRRAVRHRPSMPTGVREDLRAGYRADVDRLETLIHRDLSRWRR